jgi:hypothetical protein
LLLIRWAQISFVRMRGRGIVEFLLLCTFLSVLSARGQLWCLWHKNIGTRLYLLVEYSIFLKNHSR